MTKHVVDRNMNVARISTDDIQWLSADATPLVLEGFAFRNRDGGFRRLPVNTPQCRYSHNVNLLANMSAGGILRFRSDTPKMLVRATVRTHNNVGDIMSCGRCGFDLYAEGKYIASTHINFDLLKRTYSYTALLFDCANPAKTMLSFELNFPLYAEVLNFELGISADAHVDAPFSRRFSRPLILYGTSIEQGCCASRPGFGLCNILARRLDREVLNFGFAGSALGEGEIARTLATIRDPAAYVLAYDANVNTKRLESTLCPFCTILRRQHPVTPIVTVSLLRFPGERLLHSGGDSDSVERAERTRIHRKNLAYWKKNIHFLDGFVVLGDNFAEYFVDGCHPNDNGMLLYAESLANELQQEFLMH